MKAALFAYSRRGMETGRKVCRALTDEISCYAPERLAGEGYAPFPSPPGIFMERNSGSRNCWFS